VVNFTPLLLYAPGKSPGIHFRGNWMVPIAGLDDIEKNILDPTGTPNPVRNLSNTKMSSV
jgi:hypothetical protein